MKKTENPYPHSVAVATLHGETHLRLKPDAETRARIAKALGLHSVDALAADLAISHAANGLVTVAGRLTARVEPICVVSLEPFPQAIDEPVEIRFAPLPLIERMTKRAEENDDEGFEPPDEIVDGAIDFGALAVEFLALALDPYPRKPGAVFAGGDREPERESPFAALAGLKRDSEG